MFQSLKQSFQRESMYQSCSPVSFYFYAFHICPCQTKWEYPYQVSAFLMGEVLITPFAASLYSDSFTGDRSLLEFSISFNGCRCFLILKTVLPSFAENLHYQIPFYPPRAYYKLVKAPFTLVHYRNYCTRGVVFRKIQHLATPCAISSSQPHPSCNNSRSVLATVF